MSTLVSYDPASGEPVGRVPITPTADIPDIVQRARRAGRSWAALALSERRRMLEGLAAVVEERAEAIGRQLCLEMGKPLNQAIGEVRGATRIADELEEMCKAFAPEILEDARSRSTLYRDPYGVVAAITPWNFPFMMPHWMVLPALMAGNAVILKPSEETPLTGQAYVDALQSLLPQDVLQVVHGAEEQGRALVSADVDLVAFTGSRAAGIHILQAAGRDLKRVILELGGKDPMVVLPGTDVARAARFAARNSFRNAGQVCVSTERIYVHAELYEPFLTALAVETQRITQGPGIEGDVDIGPMINARQRDWVLQQVTDAVQSGARVIAGGEGHHGNFIRPTLLADVRHDMSIAMEETFGPIACVIRVEDDEEALRLANDTPYGLGASVWGETGRAERLARRVQAGMIGVNRGCGGVSGTPWVGARQSGYGFHSSKDGHRQFTQVRVVTTSR